MIFSHPVIELDKICHKLGSRHELTEPRSAKLLGSGEERLGFFGIDQRVDRRVRIAYDPAQVIREKLLVARVVSLRVRAFFAVQQFCRKQIRAGVAQQCFFHAVLILHAPQHVEDVLHDAVVGKGNARFQTGVHAGAVHAVEERLHEPLDI